MNNMDNDNQKQNLKWIGVAILAVAVVIAVVVLLPKGNSSPYKNLDTFAQCLSSKGLKMYGAYWCSHCQAQKAEFGTSFKYVNYIECTDKPAECSAAGVQGYPTWEIASTTLVGEQPLEVLASTTGCTLEKKN